MNGKVCVKKIKIIIAVIAAFLILSVSGLSVLSAKAATRGAIYLNAYSYFKDGDGLGHSFISIENAQAFSLTVGRKSVPAGSTVTIGLWGNLENHSGIWYNVENYAVNDLSWWQERVSIRMFITMAQLSEITDYINGHDYWNVIYNCSVFVKDIWNMVSDDDISCGFFPVNTPEILCNSIKSKSIYYTKYPITKDSSACYYDNNGIIYSTPSFGGSSSSLRSAAANEYIKQTSFGDNDERELAGLRELRKEN